MKKKSTLVASLALVGLLGIGAGTYALMSDQTDAKTNTFTVGSAINGELKEPKWDGDNFTNTNHQVEVKGEKGETLAENFVPTRVIPKDPAVANTSEGTNAWVAVTIDYPGDANSAADIEKFATIDWNTTDWTFNEDKTVAYYNTAVNAGEKTNTLFNTVTINEDATSDTMKNFKIELKAYLVQEEGYGSAKAAMTAGFNDVFK